MKNNRPRIWAVSTLLMAAVILVSAAGAQSQYAAEA